VVTVGLTLAVLKVASPHAAPAAPTVLTSTVTVSEKAVPERAVSGSSLNGRALAAQRNPMSHAGVSGDPPSSAAALADPLAAPPPIEMPESANAAPGTAKVGAHAGSGVADAPRTGSDISNPPDPSGGAPQATANAASSPAAAGHGATPRHLLKHSPIEVVEEDPLMHEAALVAEARGSLVRGDALGALRTIRAASGLRERALEPEELSIESRALRAMGRDAEAAEVDVELRSRYPDHALSR
jgi:hypothetical protein